MCIIGCFEVARQCHACEFLTSSHSSVIFLVDQRSFCQVSLVCTELIYQLMNANIHVSTTSLFLLPATVSRAPLLIQAVSFSILLLMMHLSFPSPANNGSLQLAQRRLHVGLSIIAKLRMDFLANDSIRPISYRESDSHNASLSAVVPRQSPSSKHIVPWKLPREPPSMRKSAIFSRDYCSSMLNGGPWAFYRISGCAELPVTVSIMGKWDPGCLTWRVAECGITQILDGCRD